MELVDNMEFKQVLNVKHFNNLLVSQILLISLALAVLQLRQWQKLGIN